MGYACAVMVHARSFLIRYLHNVDTMRICMKLFGSQKSIVDKLTAMRTRYLFRLVFNSGHACAVIVHTWADEHSTHILMEFFDTFPTQCRHMEHMNEGVWLRKSIIDKKQLCELENNYFSGLYLIWVMLAL